MGNQPTQLFMPGTGQLPPYFAGRDAEQRILLKHLATLRSRGTIPGDVVLTGPRGNGKTALLRWFERRIEDTSVVDAIWLAPDGVRCLDDLPAVLLPSRRVHFSKATVSVPGMGSVSAEGIGNRVASLAERLAKRCRRRAQVLFVDEAHTLDEHVGRALLNISQRVRASAPFLLVLAGTPILEDRLHDMGASFWDRSERLGIGRLGPAATFDALVKPIEEHGGTAMPDILEPVVEESQCYPYFVQIWGEALWDEIRGTEPKVVDARAVASARARFENEKEKYYSSRYIEFEKSGLLRVAIDVADAFRTETLTSGELRVAIEGALANIGQQDADTAADRLRELGYIWRPPGKVDWEPGIPSLMGYVRDPRSSSG